MIKNHNGNKLSVTASHRRSMLRNMAVSLFQHEKISTTLARAKELKSFSEKILTMARPLDLNARRAVDREIKDKLVQKKIFEVLIPRYQNRAGGYTQIFKTGTRTGDRAETALIKLIS